MITPDDLRAALAADDPYPALDRLVRDRLAAGATVAAVSDRLTVLSDAAEAWPEYTRTAADAFDRTMDALNGWCHPDARYADPVQPPVAAGTTRRDDAA